ncbi:emp24/gp25L/p24 family/GOLD-domain-containing protein [Scheffersomyces coipomensis]|uniref:emp24/gp25L/p24 family/GOLD-domain-containing protein n=1 Tax=Scheffersomyces coipomensis TaxID=1788519 RepID=UPI00315D8D54
MPRISSSSSSSSSSSFLSYPPFSSKSIILSLLSFFFLFPGYINGLGFSVPAIKAGDSSKYSSKNHLFNCVSYPTVKDDIVLVRIKSGDKLPSQTLNLNIFDDDNNSLRSQIDISNDINFMFTNLNNPIYVNEDDSTLKSNNVIDQIKRSSNNLFGNGNNNNNNNMADVDKAKADELINSDQGKSLIYICFDNLYADKSWSFAAQPRDIELFVDIKNMSTIKETNYNNFAQYFQRFTSQESKREQSSTDPSSSVSAALNNKEFTKQDFENEIQFLKTELQNVIGNLENSGIILQSLMEQEFKLRDVNEEIFEDYTKNSVILIICIVVFGLAQIIYFKVYLRRRKILY